MTTPQTPVDALAAQARELVLLANKFGTRQFAGGIVECLRDCANHLEASARALAAMPEGFALVSIEQLTHWKQRVNTLASLSLKAERHEVGGCLKTEIADVIADPLNIAGESAPTPPTAPAQDAQGEAAELLDWFVEAGGFNQGTKAPHKWVLRVEQELRRLAALRASSPAERQPLTEEMRSTITKMWRKENRNYTVGDIIDAVERAHGIVTKERT